MAKKRAPKRKSEVKPERSGENHKEEEEIANGDSSSNSVTKKKKSGVKNEISNNKLTSVAKKKNSTETASEDEDATDYEVLKIIDVRYTKSKKREFLVRWKDYAPRYDSWEPEENLSCDELIAKFLEDEDERSKAPSKELRKKPASVKLFASPGSRRSKRTGGNRKNYIEAEDDDAD